MSQFSYRGSIIVWYLIYRLLRIGSIDIFIVTVSTFVKHSGENYTRCITQGDADYNCVSRHLGFCNRIVLPQLNVTCCGML